MTQSHQILNDIGISKLHGPKFVLWSQPFLPNSLKKGAKIIKKIWGGGGRGGALKFKTVFSLLLN